MHSANEDVTNIHVTGLSISDQTRLFSRRYASYWYNFSYVPSIISFVDSSVCVKAMNTKPTIYTLILPHILTA